MRFSLLTLSFGLVLAGAILRPAPAQSLAGLTADAETRLGSPGDGGGTLANAAATTLFIGNPNGNAGAAAPVYVFQLPNVGAVANPFATASFSVALVSASDFNGFSADVYGLAARPDPAVLASDAFAGSLDSTDATRLADNWINMNGSGITTGVRTLSNAALVNYLNAQYAAGANAGKYVFLRISPDAGANIFKNTRFAAAEISDAANRPTLTYTLATPPPPNTAPILPTQADRTIEALNTLTVTNSATDADTPPQTLTYSLINPPAGASISATGVITWTPTIAQAGAAYVLETRATDSGEPPLSATNTFTVTVPTYVPPPNVAPVLPTQADRTIAAGTLLTVVNTASDANVPAQTLTYELVNPPAGASISASGVITWTPTLAQAGSTYDLETRVTDNGSPALSATNRFAVTVSEAPVPGAYVFTRDFETPGEFFGTFRITKPRDGGTAAQSGGVFSFDGVAGFTSSEVYTFDATPGDTRTATQSTFDLGAPLTVSFDARVTTTASSVGVEFGNPRDPSRNVMAYFTINTGGDNFRFWRSADGGYVGDQVGSTVTAATDAEPGGAFVRVTVTLSLSGTTPTLTLSVPGAAPVTRAFAAGDMDWTRTTVLLRLVDAGQGAGTPVQIDNFSVSAGGAPVEPLPIPAPVAPAIPAGTPVPSGANLLTGNPSFEDTSSSFGNGDFAFSGWTGRNQRFSTNQVETPGSPDGGGARKFVINWGGNLETAVASRPAVTPNFVYELKFDLRTVSMKWPEDRLGSSARLDFYDAGGNRIKTYWGPDWRAQVQSDGVYPWTTYTIRGRAPENAVSAGVRFIANAGAFSDTLGSREDNRSVEVDNFRLARLDERIDRVAIRRAPRLLEPGTNAELRIPHTATAPRTLSVRLVNASGQTVATGGYDVPAGRRVNTVWVPIPSVLPNGTYSWVVDLTPRGASLERSLASRTVVGVFADNTVSAPTVGTRDFDADHPNLVFMGRIEDSDPKRRWLHWLGSEVRVRFTGTSLALRGSAGPNGFGGSTPADVIVVVDGDEPGATIVTINSWNANASNIFPLVSGLPDGVHTARIFKSGETNQQVRVDGFRVDEGRGLLRAEPLSDRRIEVFGDSVTSGGNARITYLGYAFRLGRELDADVRAISKGGTGVASSFSGQALLGSYWDRLSFPNTGNASTGLPWDFSRWKPDAVLITTGHNDQFNNGSATFPAKYAEFVGKVREAYGNDLPIVAGNTIISNPVGHFERALLPLVATDPELRWVQQVNASAPVGAHPSTQGHAAMVDGDALRFSYADIIEETMEWGVDAPFSSYEQWAVDGFTPTDLAAGNHAPKFDLRSEGLPNLLRFSADVNPAAPAGPAVPIIQRDESGRLALTFRRARADLRYVVEVSEDLKTWTSAAVNPGTVGGDVTWTDTGTPSPRRFARLRVEPL